MNVLKTKNVISVRENPDFSKSDYQREIMQKAISRALRNNVRRVMLQTKSINPQREMANDFRGELK